MSVSSGLGQKARASTPSAAEAWPGPKTSYLLGDLRAAWADPIQLMGTGARNHGDLVRFRFAWMHYFLLNDVNAVHRVLVENAKNYKKSANYQGLRVLLGQGLLTSEGEFWRKQRKLAQPAFHRDCIQTFLATFKQCTEDMIARWEREVAGTGKPIDLHAEFMRLTFRVVGLCLLGKDLEGDASAFGDALNVALVWANQHVESVLRIPLWVPTPKNLACKTAMRTIEDVVLGVVRERRATGVQKPDLLGMLMELQDEDGEHMTEKQLRDELLTLVVAGHETTANALTFALYRLSQTPDVLHKLRVELDVSSEDVQALVKLPYNRAVVDETLRLYPPAWIVEREAIEEDVVCGKPLPKGGTIGVSPFLLHRHAKYWPRPESFEPERFLTPDPERPKNAYMPFGAGPRTCIGNVFALTEMQVVIAMLVRRFDVEAVSKEPVEFDAAITLRPKGGLPVRVSLRPAS
ncbi:MAG: cytochrome P450 [Polyangiaceae bacterium]